MEHRDPPPPPLTETPPKVALALVAMWTVAAFSTFSAAMTWFGYFSEGTMSDRLYYTPVTTTLPWILTGLLIAAAVNLRKRKNWARITGMIVGAFGALFSLAILSAGFEALVMLALYGLLFAMLLTADAKEWCSRPPQGGGART